MKTLEKKGFVQEPKYENIVIDNSLNDRPTSRIELKKLEEAREFLKKHPIPEHLLRK